MAKKDPQPIGDVIQDFLRSARLDRRVAKDTLQETWNALLGEPLAERTRVLGWDGATLKIGVHSPAVKQELEMFRKAELLSALKEKLTRPLDNIVFLIDG